MKRINPRILVIMFFALITLLAFSANAQNTFKEKRSYTTVDAGVKTNEVFVLDDKSFDVYKLETGSKYIKGVSAKGNAYPIWIHVRTGEIFDGLNVYKSKTGSFCVYRMNKSGYPTPRWLEVIE